MSAASPFDLMKIIEVIGRDTQRAALFQRGDDCIQELPRENAALLMPPLRPWVGKQKIKSFYRIFRQQMAHREQSVRAQHSHIVDVPCFPANFLNPLRQPLDTEEVFVWELFRQFAQKGTIAAAEIDLQGRVAPEKLPKIETSDGQLCSQQVRGYKDCRTRSVLQLANSSHRSFRAKSRNPVA